MIEQGSSRRRAVAAWLAGKPRTSISVLGLALVVVGLLVWQGDAVDDGMTAVVRRGTLTARLTVGGILKPVESIAYRSPLGGREAEIIFLTPEGTRVNEGDLVVRLDTTDLGRELERAAQEVRQAQVDLQVSEIEVQEAHASIDSLAEGEGALNIEEARTRLQLAIRKVERLRQEYEQLNPLMEKGFITREELKKTSDELEQAEEDLSLSRRRSEILIERTHPRDRQRAQLQLAQKEAQRENVRARVQETRLRAQVLQEQIENASIYARRPGMVVFEEYLGANPRRKIRVGDRVTASHALVTIPEVNRMLVEASASEADVHRLQPGQPATIRLEAFPTLVLAGKVTRVGTLARSSADRPLDDKRFDVIVEVDPSAAELRPEMTARVDILTGERAGVLMVPVNAVFDHQGTSVVHVIGRSGVDTRSVQLGESNDAEVEVIVGLGEGDRVALTDVAAARGAPPSPGGRAPVMMRGRGQIGTELGPR